MADKIIYLDNAATTLVNPEVLDTYNKVVNGYFANASSIHAEGQKANRLLEKSREQILSCLHLNEHEVIFTSGATEANNLAIKGYCLEHQNRGKHIIVSSVEHACVLESARWLEKFGFEVTYLPVNSKGVVEAETLKAALRDDTILVSIMAVNNETGAINPIHEIASLLKNYSKIAFHVDAVQSMGKVEINYSEIDMFSVAGHKIHSLKGSGLLIKRKKIELLPMNSGGGQENNLRSGTNDVASAASISKAVRLATENMMAKKEKVTKLYQIVKDYIDENPELYELNSYSSDNPYIINFSLKTRKASVVVEALSNNGIMISSISACHSRGEPMSYVVAAMGKDEFLSHNTLRISFDESNTVDEIKTFISALDKIIRSLKQ